MPRFRTAFLLLVAVPVLLACGAETATRAPAREGPPVVFTVNHPLAYMAGRIAGDAVRVVCPVPPARDPAFWLPTHDEIAAFQQADLILLNGADYARWVPRATLPRRRMIDTSSGFADRFIETQRVSHSHGMDGEHTHGRVAAITWLDPDLAAQQADAILAALRRVHPDGEAALRANHASLRADLAALDADLQSLGREAEGVPLLANHATYPYLARRTGLAIEALDWDPTVEPTATQWARLTEDVAARPARIMLWEAAPLASTAKRLASMGIRPVVFDPCAAPPTEGDFLTVMQANVARLRAALAR